MKRAGLLALCVALMPLGSLAQDAGLYGQRLAASCANCHGTQGNPADKTIAPLAGMESAKLIAGMRAFRDGTRPATVMQQLAKGFSDEQLAKMADYFAAQKPEAP